MKRIVSALFLLLAGCGQFAQIQKSSSGDMSSLTQQAGKCAYNYDSLGRIVSWGSAWPLKFYFEKNVPEEYVAAIRDSVSVWSTRDLKPLIEFASEKMDSAQSSGDGKNIIYWIRESGYFKTGEQGRAITRWKNGKIYDSDIAINGLDFVYFIDQAKQQYELHLKSLMIHEFGHTLGLKHVPTFQSVMFQNLNYLQIRDMLIAEDETNLRCQYP